MIPVFPPALALAGIGDDMRKLYALAILALFLVIGCGKKTEPEAAVTAPGVSAELARLIVIRKQVTGTAERPTYRGVLTVHNGYNGEITLERVEFGGAVGSHPVHDGLEQLDLVVPGNSSTELRLDTGFTWKDEAPMNFERGTLTGTVYYRGPKGKVHPLPFAVEGTLIIKGE